MKLPDVMSGSFFYFNVRETLLILLPTTDLTVINASLVSTTSPEDGILPN